MLDRELTIMINRILLSINSLSLFSALHVQKKLKVKYVVCEGVLVERYNIKNAYYTILTIYRI